MANEKCSGCNGKRVIWAGSGELRKAEMCKSCGGVGAKKMEKVDSFTQEMMANNAERNASEVPLHSQGERKLAHPKVLSSLINKLATKTKERVKKLDKADKNDPSAHAEQLSSLAAQSPSFDSHFAAAQAHQEAGQHHSATDSAKADQHFSRAIAERANARKMGALGKADEGIKMSPKENIKDLQTMADQANLPITFSRSGGWVEARHNHNNGLIARGKNTDELKNRLSQRHDGWHQAINLKPASKSEGLGKADPSKPAAPPSGTPHNKPAPTPKKTPQTALPKPPATPKPPMPKPPKATKTGYSVSVTSMGGGMGKSELSKVEHPKARAIADSLMAGTVRTPHDIATKHGVDAPAAHEIYSARSSHYGPGGKGYESFVKKVTQILSKPPKSFTYDMGRGKEPKVIKTSFTQDVVKSESAHVREYSLSLGMGGMKRWHAACLDKDDSTHAQAAKGTKESRTYAKAEAGALAGNCVGCGGELSLEPNQGRKFGGETIGEDHEEQKVKKSEDTSKYLNGARFHYHKLCEAQRLGKSEAETKAARLVGSYLRLSGFDPSAGVPEAVRDPAGVDLSKSTYHLDRVVTMLPLVKARPETAEEFEAKNRISPEQHQKLTGKGFALPEGWGHEQGSKIQAPISYKGDYVISHRGDEGDFGGGHNVSYRPTGQHHHVGRFATAKEAFAAADNHAKGSGKVQKTLSAGPTSAPAGGSVQGAALAMGEPKKPIDKASEFTDAGIQGGDMSQEPLTKVHNHIRSLAGLESLNKADIHTNPDLLSRLADQKSSHAEAPRPDWRGLPGGQGHTDAANRHLKAASAHHEAGMAHEFAGNEEKAAEHYKQVNYHKKAAGAYGGAAGRIKQQNVQS